MEDRLRCIVTQMETHSQEGGAVNTPESFSSLGDAPGESSLFEEHIRYIRSLVQKGGPQEPQYPEFDAWLRCIYKLHVSGRLTADQLTSLREAFGEAFGPATNQGFAYTKPNGYAGDFEIIDRILLSYVSPDPHLAAWDRYWNQHAAPKSVRNRKRYFHGLLDRHSQRLPSVRVLKLGLGPGRCMYEWFSTHQGENVHIHCVDIDPRSLSYASNLNRAFLDHLSFERANVFRFRPQGVFDLIWSGGLFDYLPDDKFIEVLRRLLPAIAPGGELVITNFSPDNPSIPNMLMIDWRLFHRTSLQLKDLVQRAGALEERIMFGEEPERVNLFLHVAGP